MKMSTFTSSTHVGRAASYIPRLKSKFSTHFCSIRPVSSVELFLLLLLLPVVSADQIADRNVCLLMLSCTVHT